MNVICQGCRAVFDESKIIKKDSFGFCEACLKQYEKDWKQLEAEEQQTKCDKCGRLLPNNQKYTCKVCELSYCPICKDRPDNACAMTVMPVGKIKHKFEREKQMIKIFCKVCKSELLIIDSTIACNSGIFHVSPCQTCCEAARQDGWAEV